MTAKHRTLLKVRAMVKGLAKDYSGPDLGVPDDRTLFLDQQLGGYLVGRDYRLSVVNALQTKSED